MADQNRAPEAIPAFDETADIIELDDRLDLAFDPLSVTGGDSDFFAQPNCGNGICCNS